MARHISLVLSVSVDVNETDVRVLRAISSRELRLPCGGSRGLRSRDGGPSFRGASGLAGESASEVVVSRRLLAEELGCSPLTVRRAVASLVGEGLLVARPRRAETGGQAENAYELTRLGRLVLDELCGEDGVGSGSVSGA